MSKFKASTHQKIEQTVKELLYPVIEAGKIYRFQTAYYGIVVRPVVAVDKDTVTYTKAGKEYKCNVKTFRTEAFANWRS